MKEYTQLLHKDFKTDLERIILFGSHVRGRATKESDLDLLIIIKRENKDLRNQIIDLAYELILKYGVDIAPAIFNSKEWTALTKKPTSFAYLVLKDGKKL